MDKEKEKDFDPNAKLTTLSATFKEKSLLEYQELIKQEFEGDRNKLADARSLCNSAANISKSIWTKRLMEVTIEFFGLDSFDEIFTPEGKHYQAIAKRRHIDNVSTYNRLSGMPEMVGKIARAMHQAYKKVKDTSQMEMEVYDDHVVLKYEITSKAGRHKSEHLRIDAETVKVIFKNGRKVVD